MSPIVVFFLFVLCLVLAIPVSISLGIASVLPGIFDPSFTASGTFVVRSMVGGVDSFPLLAVPMFVLSGIIMAKGGISKKLFDVFSYFLGGLKAGMPCAVVVTCLFYGVISVFYSLLVSLFIYKTMKISELKGMMIEAVRTFAPILFILAASVAFSRVLTLMQVPQFVSGFILDHFSGKLVILLVLNLLLLITFIPALSLALL